MIRKTVLTSSMEDYLEALLRLEKERGAVRVKELADHLGLTNASISTAVPKLGRLGLVTYERYGPIRLTPLGRRMARQVIRREEALAAFFQDILGIPAEQARQEACRVEHAISRESLRRLEAFLEHLRHRPDLLREWWASGDPSA
ncbi:MAG: metal-dependent transcriptional regulator [Thermodesulfobacteriota bacterium]